MDSATSSHASNAALREVSTDPTPGLTLAVDEAARLAALHRYEILDSPPESAFERIVDLATTLLDVPIALVSLIDYDRQWFKAKRGLDASETPRAFSFCEAAIHSKGTFVVPDATKDPYFADNPLVTGAAHIRFYAGVPLATWDGFSIGTLCALDCRPRILTEHQQQVLTHLAAQVTHEIEVRAALGELYREIDNGKRTQRALHGKGMRLEALLMATGNAVLTADSSGAMASWNQVAQGMLGYTAAEVLGRPSTDFVAERSRESFRAGQLRCLNEARLRGSTPDHPGPAFHETVWLKRKSGEEFPADLSRVTWSSNVDGISFGTIIRDVSERTRSEQALRRSQAHLAEAQRIAGLGSWDWDMETKTTEFSQSMCDLMGLPPDAHPSLDEFLEGIHPDDHAKVREAVDACHNGAEIFACTFRRVTAEGGLRILRSTGRRLEGWDRRHGHIVGVTQDVTEHYRRESVEREREKLAALGQLAGGVAHELNNLLQPIISLVDLARQQIQTGFTEDEALDTIEDLATVLDCGGQAREVVRKILLFARRDTPALTPVDIGSHLKGIVEFLHDVLPPSIIIRMVTAPAACGLALINVVEFTQVMTNLAVNAGHAMDNRGIMTVTLDQITPSETLAMSLELPVQPYFTVAITDTGRGMGEATKVHIFEPFFTTKPVGQGTGLGLPVVHGILRSWKGAVGVESIEGEGSTFTLYIPATPEA